MALLEFFESGLTIHNSDYMIFLAKLVQAANHDSQYALFIINE